MEPNIPYVSEWQQTLVQSFTQAFGEILQTVPKVLGMIVVLLLGYFIAKMLSKLVGALCERIGLQTAAERSGLAGSMKQVGIHRSVPFIVSALVFWGLMCVFLTAAFNILGLPTVSTAMEQIVSYIPKLLVAAVVVVLGLLVASFLRGVVATSADRVGLTYAEHLANACYYVLALMTFLAAFNQLGIQFELLNQMILIAFGAFAVGFGLAFGLGGRDVMAGILAGYYTRQRLHPGDHVTVGTMSGTVREVGPVATVIETEEDGLMNRHTIPNTKMLNEAVR